MGKPEGMETVEVGETVGKLHMTKSCKSKDSWGGNLITASSPAAALFLQLRDSAISHGPTRPVQ